MKQKRKIRFRLYYFKKKAIVGIQSFGVLHAKKIQGKLSLL